jgi:hypothetical protein
MPLTTKRADQHCEQDPAQGHQQPDLPVTDQQAVAPACMPPVIDVSMKRRPAMVVVGSEAGAVGGTSM